MLSTWTKKTTRIRLPCVNNETPDKKPNQTKYKVRKKSPKLITSSLTGNSRTT